MTQEQMDVRILRCILESIREEQEFMRFRQLLPEECQSRYLQLLQEITGSQRKSEEDLDAAELAINEEWRTYSNLPERQKEFKRFLKTRMKEAGLSVADVYSAIDLTESPWYDYQKRIGRGGRKDREYAFRLCFVLRLNMMNVYRLLELTGHGFERKNRRDYLICEALKKSVFDIERVDWILTSNNEEPLFTYKEP